MCNDRPTLQEALHGAQAARAHNQNNNHPNNQYLNQSSYTFRVPGASGSNSYLNQQQPTLSGHSQLSNMSNNEHVVSVKPHSGFQSQIEQQLLMAKQPLEHLNSTELVQAGPFRGTLLNKQEIDQWRGPVPLEQYRLHDDPNPEIVKKRMDKIKYTQR
jgi:hypothetical protein